MHGVMFSELRNYSEASLGDGVWEQVLRRASLDGVLHRTHGAFPDEHIHGLLNAVAEMLGTDREILLQELGEFVAPHMLRTYRALIGSGWKTLDVIEHAEDVIHRVVRETMTASSPPTLICVRIADDTIQVKYRSARKMCSFARGIARGIGIHYDEKIEISEDTCMRSGAPECALVIRRV